MAIVRRNHESNFTILPNNLANDTRLSPEAKGILFYLLTKSKDWRVHVCDIRRFARCGRDKCYRILRELREVGYIVVERVRDEMGRYLELAYMVYDAVMGVDDGGNKGGKKAKRGKKQSKVHASRAPENIDVHPRPEKPDPGFQDTYKEKKQTKEQSYKSSLRSDLYDHFQKNGRLCFDEGDDFKNSGERELNSASLVADEGAKNHPENILGQENGCNQEMIDLPQTANATVTHPQPTKTTREVAQNHPENILGQEKKHPEQAQETTQTPSKIGEREANQALTGTTPSRAKTTQSEEQNAPRLAKIDFKGAREALSVEDDKRYQTTQKNASTGFKMNLTGYLRGRLWHKRVTTNKITLENYTATGGKLKALEKSLALKPGQQSEKNASLKAALTVQTNITQKGNKIMPNCQKTIDGKGALIAQSEREFDEIFWPQVVKKVAKAKAKASFVKAREKASLNQIMTGLAKYQGYLLSKGTDIQFWAHPTTFLNQERWEDEIPQIISTQPAQQSQSLSQCLEQSLTQSLTQPLNPQQENNHEQQQAITDGRNNFNGRNSPNHDQRQKRQASITDVLLEGLDEFDADESGAQNGDPFSDPF